MTAIRLSHAVTVLLFVAVNGARAFGQSVPPEWHQRITDVEKTWLGRVLVAIERVPDFPKLAAPVHIKYGTGPTRQINAWEQNHEISVPIEMIRFLKGDSSALAFLLAHEAGHAKQEDEYGESCYTTHNP